MHPAVYPRTTLAWLGRRIELNRAAVLAGSVMLGLLLGGLIYVERRDAAHAELERDNIAELARNNRAAVNRLEALEEPTAHNLRAAIARFLRRELRRQLARRRAEAHPHRSPLESRIPPPAGTRPGSSAPPSTSSPATPAPRGPPGTPGQPGTPGPPSSTPPPSSPPAPANPLAPLEELLNRLPLP